MSIENLLDQIEEILDNSKSVPFSSKIAVEAEEIHTKLHLNFNDRDNGKILLNVPTSWKTEFILLNTKIFYIWKISCKNILF